MQTLREPATSRPGRCARRAGRSNSESLYARTTPRFGPTIPTALVHGILPRMAHPGETLLRAVIENAYRGKGWQGPTLSGALRGVTPAEALFRPARSRKCIWDHVRHAAYWKYAVAALLEREVLGVAEPEPFPLSPSNWPHLPAPADSAAWKRDRALLEKMHERVLQAVSALDLDHLDRRPSPRHKLPLAGYVAGIAAHDAYHCGQIQLLKRLARG